MTAGLAVVPDYVRSGMDDDEGYVEKKITLSDIPNFEGQSVDFTKASFTSGTNLEIDDKVFRTDEVVQFIVEARCAGINHKVNEKTGCLERVHSMKVIDVLPVPYEFTIEQLRDKVTKE